MTGTDRLRQIAQLARTVVSELDLETVLSQVTAALRSLRSDAVCAIRLVDADGGGYRLVGTEGFPAAERMLVVPFGEGLTHVVATTRRPLLVEDNQTDPRTVPRHWSKRSGLTTYYGVPIEAAGELLGVVNMNFPPDVPPTEDEQASIEVLAAQAAVAIRNARLFTERDERRRVAEALAEVSRALAQTLDADVIAQQVADTVRDLLRARGSFLFQLRSAAEELVAVAVSGDVGPDFDRGRAVPGGSGLAGVAIRTKDIVATPDFLNDPRVLLPPEWRRRLEPATDRAVLAAPLIVQERVIGALSIRDRTDRVFSHRDRALARAFADQAALALHNAQILNESQARQIQLEALLDVTRELSALHSMDSLLDLIAMTCGRLLDSESVGFRLLEGDELVVTGTWGDAAKIMAAPRLKIGESVSGIVAATGEPLVITDIANDPRVIPAHRETLSHGGYKHWLGVPVTIGSRLVGVLSIRTRRDLGFTERDVAIATAFAAQAAIALETARLYTDAERRRQTAERLADIGRLVTQSLDLQEVAQRVVENLRSLIPALRAAFYRVDPTSEDLRLVAHSNDPAITIPSHIAFRYGTGLVGFACRERRLVVSANIVTDTRFQLERELQSYWAHTPLRSAAAVPLLGAASVLGVLIVGDREGRIFTNEEQRVLEMFAAQAAVAVDNARLYAEAKRSYDELAHTQAQMLRVETLRAIGELAAGASHHLNNLLAVMVGRLQLALQQFDDPDLHRHLIPAERAAQDGANVVARLLRFSRGQTAPTFVSVDLNALAGEVIELTRPRWQNELLAQGIAVDVSLERGTIPAVAGDPASLREVLMNLLLNAVDAMPRGGCITVTTWADTGRVYCRVADSGTGMSLAVQQRALEPFFTTKGVRSTGLGLSANYGILQRHGGELTIDSVEGQGTRVTFRLPADQGVNESQSPTPPVAAPPLRILLIDDEREVRAAIADMLALEGHEVIEAANGADGLAQCLGDPSIDLVLTDLGMPGMTGWQLAEAVKTSRPSLPVGILTGWGEAPEKKPEERARVDFVLAKPVTRDALRSAVAHVRPRS